MKSPAGGEGGHDRQQGEGGGSVSASGGDAERPAPDHTGMDAAMAGNGTAQRWTIPLTKHIFRLFLRLRFSIQLAAGPHRLRLRATTQAVAVAAPASRGGGAGSAAGHAVLIYLRAPPLLLLLLRPSVPPVGGAGSGAPKPQLVLPLRQRCPLPAAFATPRRLLLAPGVALHYEALKLGHGFAPAPAPPTAAAPIAVADAAAAAADAAACRERVCQAGQRGRQALPELLVQNTAEGLQERQGGGREEVLDIGTCCNS